MGQEIIGRRTIRRWLDNWEHIQRREPMEDQVKVTVGTSVYLYRASSSPRYTSHRYKRLWTVWKAPRRWTVAGLPVA